MSSFLNLESVWRSPNSAVLIFVRMQNWNWSIGDNFLVLI